MTDYSEFIENFKKEFLKAEPYLPGAGDLEMRKIRHQALTQALQLHPPTPRHPLWKYALLDPLLSIAPQMHRHRAKLASKKIFHSHFLDVDPIFSLVFVNGFFIASLSHIPEHHPITIKHFRQMVDSNDVLLEELFEKSHNKSDFFQQLNVAMANDGAFIMVPSEYHSSKPIVIYHFLTDYGARHYWLSPQTHLYLEKNASAIIFEKSIALTIGQSCINAQSFITLHDGAKCEYLRIDKGNLKSYSFIHTKIIQHGNSALTVNLCSQQGLYQRFEVENELVGKKAQYDLNGLLLCSPYSHHDWVTKLHHLAGASSSSHHVRSIVAEGGQASYIGNLTVNQNANHTNADMQNHHVLLGPKGKANSSPQLEILCDDVKCNHGSTTGELDESALFYLMSRGINRENAISMLLRSHINYFIDALSASFKVCLEDKLLEEIYLLMKGSHDEK